MEVGARIKVLSPRRLARGAVALVATAVLVACATSNAPRRAPSAQNVTAGAFADSSCAAAFDSLQVIFRRDYPGYRDKVAGREAELAALADSVRAVVRTSEHHSVCVAQGLQRYARFFRDPHVMVWQAGAPNGSQSPPTSAAPRSPIDPDAPTLRYIDDSTAVLRLPSFDPAYKPAVDSVVGALRSRLLATPYLVVDVRGNGGGCTCTFDALIPVVYDRSILVRGMDVWSSPANVAFLRSWLTDPAMPQSIKESVRELLPELTARPNQFVTWGRDSLVHLDTVLPRPRRVALVVDGKCASSCEDLVLMARQSGKVVVMGTEHTAGVLDYGNVRSVWLPGWRKLRVPTSRSRRLPREPLDMIGIAPAVRLAPADTSAEQIARRYLHPRA